MSTTRFTTSIFKYPEREEESESGSGRDALGARDLCNIYFYSFNFLYFTALYLLFNFNL